MAKKILLVEDDLDFLAMMALVLKKKGYGVTKATDGEMAVAAARADKPDLVLMDIDLPKLNGYQVFDRFLKDPALNKTPVIFLTASADVDAKKENARLGSAGYLIKPFSSDELLARIQDLLN